jgi:hypothetical protein
MNRIDETLNGMMRGDTSFRSTLFSGLTSSAADFFWSQTGRSQLTVHTRTTQIATSSGSSDDAGILHASVFWE